MLYDYTTTINILGLENWGILQSKREQLHMAYYKLIWLRFALIVVGLISCFLSFVIGELHWIGLRQEKRLYDSNCNRCLQSYLYWVFLMVLDATE